MPETDSTVTEPTSPEGFLVKLIRLTVKNETTRSILFVLIGLGGSFYGVGLDNGWFGFLEGPIEKLNREKTPQYFGVEPITREILISTDRDSFECRVYKTGDAVAIRRTLRPDNTVYQQYRWLTPEPPDKTSRAIYRSILVETAYASVEGILKPDWKDKLLDRISDCVAKVQRIFPDGCWKIIVVDMCTGSIVETISAGCP